jgi:hypothetical protein
MVSTTECNSFLPKDIPASILSIHLKFGWFRLGSAWFDLVRHGSTWFDKEPTNQLTNQLTNHRSTT